MSDTNHENCQCTGSWSPEGLSRRDFLNRFGLGLGGIALADMIGLEQNRVAAATIDKPIVPHFAPKAKSVIWLFMIGGTSHLESFDYKPTLTKFAGKTISETPYASILKSPSLNLFFLRFTGRAKISS